MGRYQSAKAECGEDSDAYDVKRTGIQADACFESWSFMRMAPRRRPATVP
jgi:hypothetical protein